MRVIAILPGAADTEIWKTLSSQRLGVPVFRVECEGRE